MRFRRLVFLIITVLATFGSLMANPAGAIEPWDVTDESECLANGFVWYEGYCDYPGMEEDWDPEADCYEYGGTWDGFECEYPEWDPEADCYEYGGTWDGFECEYPEWEPEEPYDDGSLWSATNEADCLDRGGAWDSAWEYCYEEYEEYDDGSIWSATNEADCLDRGGSWAEEDGYGYCFEDDGAIWSARTEVDCLDRGGSPVPRPVVNPRSAGPVHDEWSGVSPWL